MWGEIIYSVMWEAKHLQCDVGGSIYSVMWGESIYSVMWEAKHLQCDVGGKAFTV